MKIGHKINPDFKIGCMILSVPVYPLTPEPDDVLAAKEQEHKSLMFADVHVRGKYPGYALRYFREHGISLEIEEADREVLKETVDFISLSYYMSACATAHSEKMRRGEGNILAIFIEIGKAIGVDLGITTLLGWFVLASLLINEIRSILENFVEAGFNVPIILIKGLEVADKVVNKDGDSEGE